MNGAHPQTVPPQLLRRTILLVMAWLTPSAPIAGYFVGLSLGLSRQDILWALLNAKEFQFND